MDNEKSDNCKFYTIYTEDFCVSFGKDGEKCSLKNCNAYADFLNWLEDKISVDF